MVDAHFGVIAPHASAQGPVCSAACVQLNASIPNFYIHEIFDEFNEPWEKEIVTNPVVVVNGYIDVPERSRPRHRSKHRRNSRKHPYRQENYLATFQAGLGKTGAPGGGPQALAA